MLSDDVAKDEAPDAKRLLARASPWNKGHCRRSNSSQKESEEKVPTTTVQQKKKKQKLRERERERKDR